MGKEAQEKVIREFSSGGVVFKIVSGNTLWLIAKSRKSKGYQDDIWRLPKGRIDDEMFGLKPGPKARGDIKATEEEIQKAALREVCEEGGVKAKIINKIGTEKFFYKSKQTNKNILKFVTFYLMEWISDVKGLYLLESEEVSFLPFKEAYQKLSYPGERKMLKIAKESFEESKSADALV